MLQFARQLLTPSKDAGARNACHSLWIDGVGCFWVMLGERITIGGPEPIAPKSTDHGESVDLALLSDLKRHHAAILRTGEGYLLEPCGAVRTSGRDVIQKEALTEGASLELGRTVRIRFRQPTALSLSARLEFLSDHRPSQAVDGVVLLADTCLLGPGRDNHVICPDWPGTVLLIRQGDELWCRSAQALTVNGHRLGSGRRLRSGDVIMGEDLRFRIEERC